MIRTPHRGLRVMLATSTMLIVAGCVNAPPPPHAFGGNCPSWWQFPADRFGNADSPYLGCITAANLRAMVANPADLQHGRRLESADGERETRAIEAYQQGKIRPFQGSGSLSPQSSGGGGTQGGTQ